MKNASDRYAIVLQPRFNGFRSQILFPDPRMPCGGLRRGMQNADNGHKIVCHSVNDRVRKSRQKTPPCLKPLVPHARDQGIEGERINALDGRQDEALTQSGASLFIPGSGTRNISFRRLPDIDSKHHRLSTDRSSSFASSQGIDWPGFSSISRKRASITAFSSALKRASSSHASSSSSARRARTSRRSSIGSLLSSARISSLLMSKVYRTCVMRAMSNLGDLGVLSFRIVHFDKYFREPRN